MSSRVCIVSSCRMGPGTFEAKFLPLSMVDCVEEIIVVRKERGPDIPKLRYHILPRCCRKPLINVIVTPVVLAFVTIKNKASLLLAYHYTPHFFFVYVASLITGVPYILGQTGIYDQKFYNSFLGKITLGHVIRKAVQLNVPGMASLKYWNSHGFNNVRVLHSTIDTDRFVPCKTDKSIDFLYLGRLESYKGVQHILHAFRKVVDEYPDVNLVIVGYGSYENMLKSIAASLGLTDNVSFHGFQADTYSYYCRSKVFVMASETEGLPCSLMEAMSCELLCISSLVGNIADILIDEVTGFTFESGNVNRLADLMSQVCKSDNIYISIMLNARERIVHEHSYHHAQEQWQKTLEWDGINVNS